MTVLRRVIPCLDVDAGRVVKGTNFVGLRDAGDPVELAARYDAEGADELVFLDITATHEKRETIVELARRTADDVFIPFTIGGGIASVADAQAVLDAGADKVSINSSALARPELIGELAAVFGSQCVVVAIDAKRRGATTADSAPEWDVYVAGGRTLVEGREAIAWATEAAERGAGEILLTSMDSDGTDRRVRPGVDPGRCGRRADSGDRLRRRRSPAAPRRGCDRGRGRRVALRLDLPLRPSLDRRRQAGDERRGHPGPADRLAVLAARLRRVLLRAARRFAARAGLRAGATALGGGDDALGAGSCLVVLDLDRLVGDHLGAADDEQPLAVGDDRPVLARSNLNTRRPVPRSKPMVALPLKVDM